jgi:hypothetical protein
MRKQLAYIFLFLLTIVACEEIYNPVLDNVVDLLVVEAILISNETSNYIYLSKSNSFNVELDLFIPVSGANIFLVSESNIKTRCVETNPGKYILNKQLETGLKYSLLIETEGETYKSNWQKVPEVSVMDSVYSGLGNRIITTGTANSTEDIVNERGVQVFADMKNKGSLTYYRFSSKKILQFVNYYDTVIPPMPDTVKMPIFTWKTYRPTGIFNIAGPPQYSTVVEIKKHEIEFFEKNYNKYIPDSVNFSGWIYYVYQYGINEDTYNFYSDLNSQLGAEGKIFDPVYVQAEGNIFCTSDPKKVVLGNFEISSFSEKRYFVNYPKSKDTITVFREIPYFYDIPNQGEIKDTPPDFWENTTKYYPNE